MDDQLSASSELDDNHGPRRSRLHESASGDLSGGWVPVVMDDQQWIQVDLADPIAVTALFIQGQDQTSNFVTQFYVSYSNDFSTWTKHKEPNDQETTLFEGNVDSSHVRKGYLARGFTARAVRLHPTAWNNAIGVRWEILGCPGVGSSEYLGCFVDAIYEDRDLPMALLNDAPGGMNYEHCIHHCFTQGYPYAGLQYFFQCYCGNSYGSHGPDNQCDLRCTGEPSQTCGGSLSNDIMTTGLPAAYKGCPDHWTAIGDKCFRTFDEETEWREAEYSCREHGLDSHLASINSLEEQEFLEAQLVNHQTDAWIGLNCERRDRLFEWSNGDDVRYTNWAPGEPNHQNNGENCVKAHYEEDAADDRAGKWNDQPCENGVLSAHVCSMPKQMIARPPHPVQDKGCPIRWSAYRSKCYVLITSLNNWQYARTSCMRMGGHLARVEDGSEQSFLALMISKRVDSGGFWIDLSSQEDGTFKFSNGQTPKETYWSDKFPDSHEDQSFVMMDVSDFGHWKNYLWDMPNNFVCERERVAKGRLVKSVAAEARGDVIDEYKPMESGSSGMNPGAGVMVALGVLFGVAFVAFIGIVVYKRRLSTPGSSSSFVDPMHSSASEIVKF